MKYIRYIILRLGKNPIYFLLTHIRAEYYKLFFKIGAHCSFQKIKFYRPSYGSAGKSSIQIGDNVVIFRNTELIGFDDMPIIIGQRTFINQECLIRPNVTIGKNVSIGMSGQYPICRTHSS
jgi:acetyltransferase-like isoleucine patch superfamily enzyme